MSWIRFQCTDAPESRGGHSAVVLGRKHVVIFGGNADPRRQTQAVDASGVRRGCILRDARVLDAATMTWASLEAVGQPPTARYAHAASSLGDAMMVIHGGHDGDKWLDDLVVLEIGVSGTPRWVYPIVSGQPPGARHGHTLTEIGSKILLFGGYCNEVYFNDAFILEFNADRARWTKCITTGTPPAPRAYHTATLIDRRYVIIYGGRTSTGQYLQDSAVLDITTMNWTYPKFENTPPSARAHHSATLFETKLLIIGGQNSPTSFLNDIYMLHNGKWQEISFSGIPLSPRSRHTSCLVKGNNLVIFGGYDGTSWMNDVFVVDMDHAQQKTEINLLKSRIEMLEGKTMSKLSLQEIEELEETYLRCIKLIGKAKYEAIRRDVEQKGVTAIPHSPSTRASSGTSPVLMRPPIGGHSDAK